MSTPAMQPIRLAAGSTPKRQRVSLPQLARDPPVQNSAATSSSHIGGGRPLWAELPQDVGVVICQCLGPHAIAGFYLAGRKTCEVSRCEEVWRFFCRSRWAGSANVGIYRSARDLFLDGNGWFPQRAGKRQNPRFEAQEMTLHASPCLTMDMRMTNEEIVTVSEAARDESGVTQQACVHVIDPDCLRVRQRIEVSRSTVNCCDVGLGAVCLGSDDFKVRLYTKAGISSADGCASSAGSYELTSEYLLASEVNDLRFTREDVVIAVRTHQNRHPAGLDLIHVHRPEARVSFQRGFQGGSAATRGKYIHALDGFEDGCSLSGIACSGEDAMTSAFSAMLFDFRRSAPCVVDLPVTSQQQGHQHATMLWPLRAGRAPQVYANLLDESRHNEGGIIAMVDFRYPSMEVAELFRFPDPVDDFSCLDGSIYAACTEVTASEKRIRLYRATSGQHDIERLCTVVEDYDACSRNSKEDLKVFSICSRGFAMTHGEQLSLGRLGEPRHFGRPRSLTSPAAIRAPRSVRSQRSLLVSEELPNHPSLCSF